ncbi:Gp49 family protein [Castellaniella ginsengisoli]|uniref:Gp49 family protein n=1 Tax=Castellaniella ginsengisoli TaxID=546114 RepID=A0AB39DP92_9BURK
MNIEQEIQAKGLTAPRITPADIQANIASEHYFTAADGASGAYRNGGDVHPAGGSPGQQTTQALGLLTFCVLVLRNGFTVTGESACASPENFDAEIGRKIARQNAVSKVWPLMGYALRTELSRPALTEVDAAADVAGTPRPDHPII